MNGSAVIHDFEIALCGSTSEDVEEQIEGGRFGMARETAEYINAAIGEASANGIGIGESVGLFITGGGEDRKVDFRHRSLSILAEAYSRKIPVTVHVAVGTDIIHAHPQASGSS